MSKPTIQLDPSKLLGFSAQTQSAKVGGKTTVAVGGKVASKVGGKPA